ncbi:hypothetical protein M406DRAFT_35678 [Cryphonectria parasitica EP155]|uniref:Uncharacterized protein n=1 Tax=Cryphonectria parasitica (strain ATCC 38755 / EP155) TaxID=660469 RepID=A0A9P4YB14_CRYP1|nr:uncharacterized protein M406DRAFT_35678 [Cryphonectria parasitica EP155]KAF3770227.1 hypothetical protein M406DRAFT_35678 [Cryphonectria parasitica EP155]
MSKIRSYTPSWLSRPAPGHNLFQASQEDINASASSRRKMRPGPRRTIARRGTEVFVAVNREIRWGDLVYLKESWAEKPASTRIKREDSNGNFSVYDQVQASVEGSDGQSADGYRIIKTPVADEIRQLVMSPNSEYLAILTTHTVHICALPKSSLLTDSEPLKPRFFTLGPTTHITMKSAVMSAVWHPLGVQGTSLVTVTEDAVVRLWEISTSDRWSFDAPTLAIDLKKLADGTAVDQDFSVSTTTNRGFSADTFDMEVAAASFAVRGSGLWSSMTLYIAMRGGDVYALCPLLPQLWAPPPTLIPSLSVSIVAKVAAIEDDPNFSPQDRLLAQQQLEWMSDLDSQEPRIIQETLADQPIEVYQRPTHPGLIPRLQGPFDLESAPEEDEQDELDIEVSDIYVIGRKMETDELMGEEDEVLELDDEEQQGLSLTVICLLSTSGQVRICLDMEGVEARWLPPRLKGKAATLSNAIDLPSLLTFETLDTVPPSEVTEDCWPTFSDDALSRYSFFITHNSGITQVSLAPWVYRLESELEAEAPAGSELRVNLIAQANSEVDRIYAEPASEYALAASVAIRDPDLGYFLLSATPTDPIALVFDTPEDDFPPIKTSTSPTPFPEPTPDERAALELYYTPRPAFQPPTIFDQPSDLPKLRQAILTGPQRALMGQEVRLSPMTLKIFSNAHQILSTETGRLNEAVAEVFRRCDVLRSELKDQISRANELKTRVDHITGGNGENPSDDAQSEEGTTDAKAGKGQSQSSSRRLDEIRRLKEELTKQVAEVQGKDVSGDGGSEKSLSASVSSLKIPAEIRKAKVTQVMHLLDRENELVDALQGRLERLAVG